MKHIVFEAYAMTTPYVGVGEFCRQLGSRLGQQAAALRDNHGVELHFIVPPRLRGCFGKDVRYIAMPVPLLESEGERDSAEASRRSATALSMPSPSSATAIRISSPSVAT